MLILSRRVNERIVIDNTITVSVIDIRHDHVRIGVEAPPHVKVYRQELYRAIQQENLAAARSASQPLPTLPAISPDERSDATSAERSDATSASIRRK